MKVLKSFVLGILVLALSFGWSIVGVAQQVGVAAVPPQQDIFFYRQFPEPGSMIPAPGQTAGTRAFDRTVTFISAVGPGEGGTITGAPYSADAVTEAVQMLADGNRIVRKVSSHIARDHEGHP